MIVMVNDFFLFFAADAGLPAVAFEIVGDAGHLIGIGEQVNGSVIIAVLAVGQDTAGHKLGIPHGAGE